MKIFTPLANFLLIDPRKQQKFNITIPVCIPNDVVKNHPQTCRRNEYIEFPAAKRARNAADAVCQIIFETISIRRMFVKNLTLWHDLTLQCSSIIWSVTEELLCEWFSRINSLFGLKKDRRCLCVQWFQIYQQKYSLMKVLRHKQYIQDWYQNIVII